MRYPLIGLSLVLAALAIAPEVRAQACASVVCRPQTYFGALSDPGRELDLSPSPGATTPGLALGGTAGFGVGMLGGAALGYAMGAPDDYLGFPLLGVVIGGVVGGVVGAPAGVHIANGRRGDFPLAVLGSAGAGIAGALLYGALHKANPSPTFDIVFAAVIPVSQISASIYIERATSWPR